MGVEYDGCNKGKEWTKRVSGSLGSNGECKEGLALEGEIEEVYKYLVEEVGVKDKREWKESPMITAVLIPLREQLMGLIEDFQGIGQVLLHYMKKENGSIIKCETRAIYVNIWTQAQRDKFLEGGEVNEKGKLSIHVLDFKM